MKHLPLIMAMLLSGSALAEETVYYCSEDGSTGFHNKTGRYEQVRFNPQRFKMKLLDDRSLVIDDPHLSKLSRYSCSRHALSIPWKTCDDDAGYAFNFNLDNGRFVLVRGFGYVFNVSDAVSVSIGTCTKF